MWVSIKEMLELCRRRHLVVGAFHAVNLEQAQGVIEAGVEEQVPVILALNERGAMHAGLGAFIVLARELSAEVPVPVSVVLDHVRDRDLIMAALGYGYPGILVEAGLGGEGETFEFLFETGRACNKEGVFFEVSLWAGSKEHALNTHYIEKVEYELNPDSICITISGDQRTKPSKDTLDHVHNLLKNIHKPVSLAGVGRWDDTEIKKLIQAGAWKISVGTRLNRAFTHGIKHYLASESERVNPLGYLGAAQEAYRQEIIKCIRLFCSG